jgi:hypothetical protein
MRTVLVVLVAAACAAAAVVTWAAGPPAARPGLQMTMSTGGMEGLKLVYIQPHVAGDPQWQKAVGYGQKDIEQLVKERVGRFPGLKLASAQSPETPRLLVQVVGHVIQGYGTEDPPAAMHITLALAQPVMLARRGADGKPIVTTGTTMTTTMFSTGKASTMHQRLRDKLLEVLGEMEQDYRRANPGAR